VRRIERPRARFSVLGLLVVACFWRTHPTFVDSGWGFLAVLLGFGAFTAIFAFVQSIDRRKERHFSFEPGRLPRSRALAGLCLMTTMSVVFAGYDIPTASASSPIVRAAFYYPWYPGAWTQGSVYPFSNYTPSLGYYSSDDENVIRQQIGAMQYANLDAGIISWWGQGSQADNVVPEDLAAADGTGFKWSLYYEPEGYSDPTVSQIQSDLSYIKAKYTGNSNYLRINGEPVLFVYADAGDGCTMAQRWNQANATEGFYVVLKVFNGYRSCAGDASAWHQYDPAAAEDNQTGYSFSISPGFYKSGTTAPDLARNLSTWAQNVRDMVASNEPLQLITTFNEWGEGTAVESAVQWASSSGYGSYLDVMHQEIPPPRVGSRGGGYWLASSDGGIFSFGDAGFYGSEGGQHLNAPIVGIAPTADGGGYWLASSDGGIFSFGDAGFYGSEGSIHLNKPIVGMAVTPSGNGYWLVASDGGIFSHGDAQFYGSTGSITLDKPIVDMAVTSSGNGYWLASSDGGIFSFGDAGFYGSQGGRHLNATMVGMAPTGDGGGYGLAASDGGVFSFGDAGFYGSEGGQHLNAPIVGMAPTW